MPSFKTLAVAAVTVLASVARADYYIDPDTVSLGTRTFWCASEISTCPIICAQFSSGPVSVNTCDPEALTYGCVCSNGIKPNVTEYSLTLPYFTCTEWGNQCVLACGQDSECARSCREDHPCGALNPKLLNTTQSVSATASKTSSGSSTPTESNAVFDGLDGTGANPTTTPSTPGAAVRLLESSSSAIFIALIGTIALGAGLF